MPGASAKGNFATPIKKPTEVNPNNITKENQQNQKHSELRIGR